MNCPKCGSPLKSGSCERCTNKVVFRIVQREVVLLVVLCLLVIPLFIFTRSMADRNRAMHAGIASTWYRLGQEQLRAGNTESAIESFRKAATSDHDNPEYALVLATALAGDQPEEARQILLRLRVSAPERGEINLNLARLAAKEGQLAEAVHYYHNALFGIWPADQMVQQRIEGRTELIRFLLAHGETSQALSELLILSSDIPDSEEAHTSVGQLFLAAGDSRLAMEQFVHALRLNAKNVDALDGAGRASFELADYSKARRYLETAAANGSTPKPEAAALLEITGLVLSRDPLAAGIGTEQRIRRLLANLEFVSEELRSCLGKGQEDQDSQATLRELETELNQDIESRFRPRALRRDSGGFTAGLDLIGRIESATGRICRESSSLHTALTLIARKHGVGDQ